jgi:hypothetical protein
MTSAPLLLTIAKRKQYSLCILHDSTKDHDSEVVFGHSSKRSPQTCPLVCAARTSMGGQPHNRSKCVRYESTAVSFYEILIHNSSNP